MTLDHHLAQVDLTALQPEAEIRRPGTIFKLILPPFSPLFFSISGYHLNLCIVGLGFYQKAVDPVINASDDMRS